MKTIQEFLGQKFEDEPKQGQTGHFTDWLAFYELQLAGDALQFTETRVLGLRGNDEYECYEIPVSPGAFVVECKGVSFGADLRIAGLRAYPEGVRTIRGKKVSEIPVDMGGVSVVDIATVYQSMEENREAYEEWIEDTLYGSEEILQFMFHEWELTKTTIPSVESGFGDGTYDLYELISDGIVVGLEVEFINEETTY